MSSGSAACFRDKAACCSIHAAGAPLSPSSAACGRTTLSTYRSSSASKGWAILSFLRGSVLSGLALLRGERLPTAKVTRLSSRCPVSKKYWHVLVSNMFVFYLTRFKVN
jgi:hypothetical protein